MNNEPEMTEVMPVEKPENDLSMITQEGDVEAHLAILEKKAALAPRFKAVIETILAAQTYAEDWTEHGSMMCLGSAGAERVARSFDIKFFEVAEKKESFTDAHGNGYRYVYSGKATMGNRVIHAIGQFSTRDKFLGYKDNAYRPLEDINENSIRQASYHIFIGNAIKCLLGLRGVPKSEWEKVMHRTGKDPSQAKAATYGAGTQGGTAADDTVKQKQLAEACIYLANAGWFVVKDGRDFRLTQVPFDQEELPELELAKAICVELTTFTNKDGKEIKGKGAKDLRGKRLDIALSHAEKLMKEVADEPATSNH